MRHRLSADMQKTLGFNIRTLRVRRGLTQRELAGRVLIDSRALQAIESGHQGISLGLFLAMSDALNATPTQLLKGLVPYAS